MRIKHSKIIAISIVILISFSPIIANAKYIESNNYQNYVNDQHILEGSRVEEVDGVTILYVNGSYYEMGYQHGYLLKEKIQEFIPIYIKYFENKNKVTYNKALDIWNKSKKFFPQDIIDEMQGLSDGSGVSFQDIAVSITISTSQECSVFSASGPATSDGKLYYARSLDWSEFMKDPDTGEYIDRHVFFVRNPDNGYSSIYPGYIGSLISYGGINEKELIIGFTGSRTGDETYDGILVGFRAKLMLDQASNISEAIDIIDSNKTFGYNFILSDGKTKESVVIEQTANISYIGKWDDPVESTYPCCKIDHVIRRTNFFINRTAAKTQRYVYNPRSSINTIGVIFPKHRYHWLDSLTQSHWMHYKALSDEIKKKWGNINLFETMSIVRDVYNGENNWMFKLNTFWWKHFKIGYYASHQWVACPETGDMLVSFGNSEKRAFEQPVHYLNLFDLLEP